VDANVEHRNREALEGLRLAASSLSQDELRRPIDPPWTPAALFAHLAFWERFTRARWLEALHPESGVPVPFEDVAMELVNTAGLPGWLALGPGDAVEQCLRAAGEMDECLVSLEPDVVSQVLQDGRPRLVDRSIHRNEHLATIVAAFEGLQSRITVGLVR
jgi:hypothetical protein